MENVLDTRYYAQIVPDVYAFDIGHKLFLTTCLGLAVAAIILARQTRASRFSVLPWAKRKTHTLPIARLLRKIFHPRYKALKYYCASLFQGHLQIGITELSPDLSWHWKMIIIKPTLKKKNATQQNVSIQCWVFTHTITSWNTQQMYFHSLTPSLYPQVSTFARVLEKLPN